MALKKDKQKVLGEVFDEARVRGFLTIDEQEGVSTDYRLLERAYRGMKAENFNSFVTYFCESGKDINARNPEGLNILQVVAEHNQSSDYCDTLKKAGAHN